jgi:hypothetical protein
MKTTLENYMRDLVVRLEAAERPDGSVYVTSPTFPLFRVVIPKSENVAERAFGLLKEYMQLRGKRDYVLQPADDAAESFDGEKSAPHIPAYVIAQVAA